MPTIEVISELSNCPVEFEDLKSFSLIGGFEIESHRSLFEGELKKVKGWMAHLGDPDLVDPTEYWAASDLIDLDFVDENTTEFSYRYRFNDNVKIDLMLLMQRMLLVSRTRVLYFLTDYQLGKPKGSVENVNDLESFFEILNSGKLVFNVMYIIGKKSQSSS